MICNVYRLSPVHFVLEIDVGLYFLWCCTHFKSEKCWTLCIVCVCECV
uniref:Uncharacterized protein n=1 Tax=Anguilla anguilla TaxID=7936 RepID=A0A0E9UHB6_ANGAN